MEKLFGGPARFHSSSTSNARLIPGARCSHRQSSAGFEMLEMFSMNTECGL